MSDSDLGAFKVVRFQKSGLEDLLPGQMWTGREERELLACAVEEWGCGFLDLEHGRGSGCWKVDQELSGGWLN